MTTDVLIIGGGVIGLTIARELRARGVDRIMVVDRGPMGSEASWAAAGMLAPNVDANAPDVFRSLCIQSLELFPLLAEGLLTDAGVDIELDRSGTVGLAFSSTELTELAVYRARGAEPLTGDQVRMLEPAVSDRVVGGVLFPNDWQVENRKLINALTAWAKSSEVELLENTAVSELRSEKGKITGAVTSRGCIDSGTTVLATGAWTSLIKIGESPMPFEVKPVRGQMAAFQMGDRKLRRVIYSTCGYLVPRSDGRVLVGATVEDTGFEKATTDDAIESLRETAVEIVPELANFPIVERWSGLRPYVADGLPVIGGLPGVEGVLVATAHYRNGILLAPRTAQLIADKIVDDLDSEFFVPFGAGRFGAPAANVAAKS